jgi:hypothetical protein
MVFWGRYYDYVAFCGGFPTMKEAIDRMTWVSGHVTGIKILEALSEFHYFFPPWLVSLV